LSWLNDDCLTLIDHSLLRRALQIPRVRRAPAHNLYCVEHTLLLIEIGISKRLSPRQILIQICQH
jgi:hypothetical protein